jgi:hypothetical protein
MGLKIGCIYLSYVFVLIHNSLNQLFGYITNQVLQQTSPNLFLVKHPWYPLGGGIQIPREIIDRKLTPVPFETLASAIQPFDIYFNNWANPAP